MKASHQYTASLLKSGVVAAMAGAILLSVPVTRAQGPSAIYFEEFGNTNAAAGKNFSVSSVGWVGKWGPTATDSSNPAPDNFGISSSIGATKGYTNINDGAENNSTNGYIFTSGTGASLNNWIAYQNTYTVDTSAYSIQDISFYCASASLAGFGVPGARVAVQIDGNWYATTQVFSNSTGISSGSGVAAGAQQVVFNWTTAASAWDSLSFVPGSTLVLGSALSSPLPGDNLTAFGLYSDQEVIVQGGTNFIGNATRRFDSYEIDATVVPEPSTFALALVGLGVLWKFSRRYKA